MIEQTIGQAVVVGIPVAGLLAMFWYITTWKPRPVLPLPPLRQMSSEEWTRREKIKDTVFTVLLIAALVPVGLVFLVLVVFGLYVLVEDPSPMLGVTVLLTLILIKLYSK